MDTEMNQIIGFRLKELRINAGLEQRDVADYMTYKSDTTISKWENGKNLPNGGKLAKLAQLFNTTTDYILYGKEEPTAETTTLSLVTETSSQLHEPRQEIVLQTAKEQLKEQQEEERKAKVVAFPTVEEREATSVWGCSSAAAGRGYSYIEDDYEEYITYDDVPPHDFATLIDGDSMEPDYPDGNLALVQRSSYGNPGVYIVDYDGKSYMKYVYRDGDTFVLKSFNEEYNDIIIDLKEVHDNDIWLNFIGQVIASVEVE